MRFAIAGICAVGAVMALGVVSVSAADRDRDFVVAASGNPSPYANEGGIAVLDAKGIPVAGSPFNPTVRYTSYGSEPTEGPMGFPVRMTLDPSGEHLYAIYYSGENGYGVAAFNMSTGKPKLVSSVAGVISFCCTYLPSPQQIFLTAHDGFLFFGSADPFPDGGATMSIFRSHLGELTFYANVTFGTASTGGSGGINVPLSVRVDTDEHYVYVTYNSADNNPSYGTCTATQCVAIYDISHVRQQPSVTRLPGVLVSMMPNLGDFLVGHN